MDNIFQITTSILETGVISFVVFMIIRGLKTEISSLKNQISIQGETIKTMDKRIEETEKIGALYKKLVADFPQAIDDYQAVITKTKDKTIYELKNKIEEQDLTIEQLKVKAEHGDISTSARAAVIGKLFIDKENKELLQFIQALEIEKDKVFEAMFKADKFDLLISSLRKEVIQLPDEDNDSLHPRNFQKLKSRTANFGQYGQYMVTFDDKIYISRGLYRRFKQGYESLA